MSHKSTPFAIELVIPYFLAQCSLTLLLAVPSSLSAGICNAGSALSDQKHDFQISAGYSPQSATLLGTTTDRRFVLVEASYGYRCWDWKDTSISYTAAIMPAAILLQPSQLAYNRSGVPVLAASHAVYGFGFTPIGLSSEFLRQRRLHPFLAGDLGAIVSTEPIPQQTPNATSFNFLFDFGVGLRWNLNSKHALSFGYKFLHISNAGRTSDNPGVDNNVFYVGFSLLR